jgi:hypothetical protein
MPRSDDTPIGWSAYGGQTLSPYRREGLDDKDQPVSLYYYSYSCVMYDLLIYRTVVWRLICWASGWNSSRLCSSRHWH